MLLKITPQEFWDDYLNDNPSISKELQQAFLFMIEDCLIQKSEDEVDNITIDRKGWRP